MSQSIENAIAALVDKAAALTGMRQVPSAPVEAANQFPFSVCYERAGELTHWGSGFADQLVTLVLEVHVGRTLLSQAIETAMALRDPLLKAIIGDPTLSATVSTVNAVRWLFGRMQWGDTPTIGYRFEIDVKVGLTA